MKKRSLLLAILLSASLVYTSIAKDKVSGPGLFEIGVVLAVDKETFTIQPENGKKRTFVYGPDMGKKPKPPNAEGMDFGVTPDQIKVGMIVMITAYTKNKDGNLVCERALIIVERLGKREIDFSPMLPKDKNRLPKFLLRIQLLSRPPRFGSHRAYNRGIVFKEGTSIKEVRDSLKRMLSHDKWKVQEEGDSKLLIECFMYQEKEEPVKSVKIEAEGLPKEQQPTIRLIEPPEKNKSK